jgi:hypothetical protein
MLRQLLVMVFATGALVAPELSHGFAGQPMRYVKATGNSQIQFTHKVDAGRMADGFMLIRGATAETLYKRMDANRELVKDSQIVAAFGRERITQVRAVGEHITCGMIGTSEVVKREYACAMRLQEGVSFTSVKEPFDPKVFNYALAYGGPTIFQNTRWSESGRSIASIQSNLTVGTLDTYFVMPANRYENWSDSILMVIQGDAAKKILTYLESTHGNKPFQIGMGKGMRNDDMACVFTPATMKAPAKTRCALQVVLKDGRVGRKYNPLLSQL